MDDMNTQNMMNYSSYDGFLTGLLGLLIKFLFIVIIISIIIGVAIWIKNNFFKNTNLSQFINQNPIMKAIFGIAAALLILFLLLFFFSYLIGSNSSMVGYGNVSTIFNFTGIITFLFKILILFFIITLVVSLIAYMINLFGINDFHLFQAMNNSTSESTSQDHNNFTNIPKATDEQEIFK
ncbi:hypothetical protein [Anaeromicropila herbilytica]|uniref:Uncharacterized protein n=1 Tax=Anaeromicropila herbilytica TaxID=2785025 RepID=A0A7R7EIW6_9FIRM|nr:hypothetical protein [Anaeromicropila herbilytica]BCN29574.1 hypothetical protein bsdtb5_08690 [Anaeromicropila herbilytica]